MRNPQDLGVFTTVLAIIVALIALPWVRRIDQLQAYFRFLNNFSSFGKRYTQPLYGTMYSISPNRKRSCIRRISILHPRHSTFLAECVNAVCAALALAGCGLSLPRGCSSVLPTRPQPPSRRRRAYSAARGTRTRRCWRRTRCPRRS